MYIYQDVGSQMGLIQPAGGWILLTGMVCFRPWKSVHNRRSYHWPCVQNTTRSYKYIHVRSFQTGRCSLSLFLSLFLFLSRSFIYRDVHYTITLAQATNKQLAADAATTAILIVMHLSSP